MKLPAYPHYKPSGVSWLDYFPATWRRVPLKRIVAVPITDGPHETPDFVNDGVPFASAESVFDGRVNLEAKRGYISPEAHARYSRKYCPRRDDVFVVKSGSTTGKVAIVDFDEEFNVWSPLAAIRCIRSKAIPKFVFFALGSEYFQRLVQVSWSFGTQPNIGMSVLQNLELALPSTLEQQAIVLFLDRETARIDRLVLKKRMLIERLKEKRAALISRTVTRGLTPAAARAAGLPENVSYKPSGFDWLGEIPAHWKVLPFTKYVAEKSDYRGKTPDKQPDGVFLVTARNIRMGFIDYDLSQEFVSREDYDEIMRRGLPKKGDILFTTEAPLGNVALVDREDIALAQRIIRFRMSPLHFDNRFTLLALMSDHFQVQLKSLSTGSTAEGLKASKLPLLRLVAPPLREQVAISAYLDTETAKVDALVARVEEAIERLQEYRTALITAAVTGKIDVRKAAT